jgi:hypothetical protein
MPADNLVCRNARLRMCLRTPAVRDAAIEQRKAATDSSKRLEQVGGVALEEQYGGSRHGLVHLPRPAHHVAALEIILSSVSVCGCCLCFGC